MYRFPLENNQTELITDPQELLRLVQLTESDFCWEEHSPESDCPPNASESQENVSGYGWPLKVTRHFAARIKPGNPTDPLLIQIMPSPLEKIKSPDFTRNPLKEQETACPNLLTKYSGRALILTTTACAGACRYCFRRCFNQEKIHKTKEIDAANREKQSSTRANLRLTAHLSFALDYIRSNNSIQEVLLSGGDPLMLDNLELGELLESLADIPHVRRIRIHSRLPIYYPPRIDNELLTRFTEINNSQQAQLFFVVHVNHGQEIDNETAAKLKAIRQTGTVTLQQGVLLRGVNDNPDVLVELYEKLADLGVVPYYLHQLDHVEGAAHFEVSDIRARALIQTIRGQLSGFAVPLLVREYPDRPSKEPV